MLVLSVPFGLLLVCFILFFRRISISCREELFPYQCRVRVPLTWSATVHLNPLADGERLLTTFNYFSPDVIDGQLLTPDGTDMSLLDFIKTADPRKVQAAKVQKKDDQVKQLESTSHCLMPLVIPAIGGSNSAAAPEVSAPEVSAPAEPENVVPEDTYLDLMGPDEVVATQLGKSKRKRLGKQSDTPPAKQLRKDHPSSASGTGGKTLPRLR
ncbi:hypothetical protein Tco_1166087 [Tanacetum coccineum]